MVPPSVHSREPPGGIAASPPQACHGMQYATFRASGAVPRSEKKDGVRYGEPTVRNGLPAMGISNTSSTRPYVAGDLVALRYAHHTTGRNEPKTADVPASTSTSSDNASHLAAAVAAALSQVGLTAAPAPTTAMVATAPYGADTPSRAPKAQQQVQQYRNVASAFSNLAQALEANSASTASASGGSSNLTAVFKNLWTSMGASSSASADASSAALPSLQSFTQTLAQNIGESGISGLRGLFVDAVV